MKFRTIFTIVALLFSTAPSAQQPATLADLEAQGAKKLTKEELSSLIPGSTNQHPSFFSINERRFEHRADGQLYAHAVGAFIRSGARGDGKWFVNDEAQYCVDLVWPGSGQGAGPEKWCVPVYQLGDTYYAVWRSGKAFKHTFKK